MRSLPCSSSLDLDAQGLAALDDVGQRRPMFALQPLEQREPVFDLLQPGRRRLDAVGIAAQVQGEILELRLDAVARVEVRLKHADRARRVRRPGARRRPAPQGPRRPARRGRRSSPRTAVRRRSALDSTCFERGELFVLPGLRVRPCRARRAGNWRAPGGRRVRRRPSGRGSAPASRPEALANADGRRRRVPLRDRRTRRARRDGSTGSSSV